MHPTELVEKYILDPERVIEHSESLDALLQFGTHQESVGALTVGAENVVKQFYGKKGFVFLATQESADTAFRMFPLAKRLRLNGADASLARRRLLQRGQGLLWEAARESRSQLATAPLQELEGYVELSKDTQALLNIPIVTRGGTRSVLSIESSDAEDLQKPQTKKMITHLTQLVLLFRLNSEIGTLTEQTEALKQEGKKLRQVMDDKSAIDHDAVFGFEETLEVLTILGYHGTLPFDQVVRTNGHDGHVFHIICRLNLLGLVRYDEQGLLSLTEPGRDEVRELRLLDDADFGAECHDRTKCGGQKGI